MKKFIKENWFKLILALCALVIAFGYLWNVGINKEKKYQECVSTCEKTKVCLDEAKYSSGGVKAIKIGGCRQYSSTVACKNICVEKYK